MTPLERESKRFTENVGKCWHENYKGEWSIASRCEHCGVKNYATVRDGGIGHTQPNLTYDNPVLIRSELERVNKIDGFVEWLWDKYKVYYPPTVAHQHLRCKGVNAIKVAKTLPPHSCYYRPLTATWRRNEPSDSNNSTLT